jgi:hypothetical protein
MPGRGPQTFKKRQKEQERKERQQEKFAKRLQRKAERAAGPASPDIDAAEEHTPEDQPGEQELDVSPTTNP